MVECAACNNQRAALLRLISLETQEAHHVACVGRQIPQVQGVMEIPLPQVPYGWMHLTPLSKHQFTMLPICAISRLYSICFRLWWDWQQFQP